LQLGRSLLGEQHFDSFATQQLHVFRSEFAV
jgi:hypothetical protein